VFSNPRHPGKSSSKIVTLQIVSSPSSLSTDFSMTLPSVKVAYPSIGSPWYYGEDGVLVGSYNSTKKSRSGSHSSSSTIGT